MRPLRRRNSADSDRQNLGAFGYDSDGDVLLDGELVIAFVFTTLLVRDWIASGNPTAIVIHNS